MSTGRRRVVRASRRRRQQDERGAVAILVAALSVLLLVMAAMSVDIGLQINRKHQLWATLDSAAQAGASKLPSSTTDSRSTALSFALTHDVTETGTDAPNVDFWCIVAANTAVTPYKADATQIPSTCYPGAGTFTNGQVYNPPGSTANAKVSCSATLCAIPCAVPASNTGTPQYACNTIRVYQGRSVPFSFAPAGGIRTGNTGGLVSVACKGTCGTVAPNPMDVAVVADRTPSMEDADLAKMITGIKGMLGVMTPSQQYVALGSIGRSEVTSPQTGGNCKTTSGNSTTYGLSYPSDSVTEGTWMPIAFSTDYQNTDGTLNTGSALVKGVNCLSNSSDAQQTLLAAPFKAAARYLLGNGYDPNNISSLPARTSTPAKVLIFETDGQPFESPSTGGSTSLSNSAEPYSNYIDNTMTKTSNNTYTVNLNGGVTACQNLLTVASAAKQAGILVIVVGYNMVYSSSAGSLSGWAKRCTDYDGYGYGNSDLKAQSWTYRNGSTTYNIKKQTAASSNLVSTVLAAAASPTSNGVASAAQNTCSTDAERATENADGDYFFCAASGDDMAPIFKTALAQATKGIKLMNLPGS